MLNDLGEKPSIKPPSTLDACFFIFCQVLKYFTEKKIFGNNKLLVITRGCFSPSAVIFNGYT